MENRVLLIMRGLPGSGKSRFVRNVHDYASLLPMVKLPARKPEVASADDWFQKEDGWKFDPTQLGAAHNACFCCAMYLMQEDRAPLVVVDNTNMTCAEIAPYYALGNALGYEVVIVHIKPPLNYGASGQLRFDVLAKRNVHGVPEEAIRKMAGRREEVPPYWREEFIATM